MKKLILNTFILVIIVFALDFAIGRTLRYFYFKQTAGENFNTTYAIERTQADILVFGSSRANHHYVPEIFEDSLKLSFYTTGRDGAPIFFQLAVLKSVLKRYTPKAIIIDCSDCLERDEHDYDKLSSLLPYYRTHEEIRNIIELKSRFEKIKLLSEIYPFNSQIHAFIVDNLEAYKKRKPYNKGYVGLTKEWQGNADSIPNITMADLDTSKSIFFHEFIHTAIKSGAKVFVIYSPLLKKYDKNPQVDICRAICSSENVPFWDFSKDTVFLSNKSLFNDPVHLNSTGASIFSNKVVAIIKQKLH